MFTRLMCNFLSEMLHLIQSNSSSPGFYRQVCVVNTASLCLRCATTVCSKGAGLTSLWISTSFKLHHPAVLKDAFLYGSPSPLNDKIRHNSIFIFKNKQNNGHCGAVPRLRVGIGTRFLCSIVRRTYIV